MACRDRALRRRVSDKERAGSRGCTGDQADARSPRIKSPEVRGNAIDSADPIDFGCIRWDGACAQERRTDPHIHGRVNVMAATIATGAPARAAKPWYKILYLQVLIAILLGVVVGWLWPVLATNDWIKALGDGFIKLIKMVIAPIIFCTVVSGISHIQDARKVGRVGVKAVVYCDIVSSFALILGLAMGNLIQAGHGLAAKPDAAAVANYVKQAEAQKSVDFVLNIIPDSVVGALARGDILQVLLFAILFGFSLSAPRG